MHGKFEFHGTDGSHSWLTLWPGPSCCHHLRPVLASGLRGATTMDRQEYANRWKAVGIHRNGDRHLLRMAEDPPPVDHHRRYICSWGWCTIKRWQVDNTYFADPGDIENL